MFSGLDVRGVAHDIQSHRDAYRKIIKGGGGGGGIDRVPICGKH